MELQLEDIPITSNKENNTKSRKQKNLHHKLFEYVA